MMRKLLFSIPIILFVLLSIGLGVKLESKHSTATPSPLLNKPFPAFTLPSIFSGEAGLDSRVFKGKPVLVNVFASWCASCKIEHSLLLQIAQAKHIPLYGINWKDKDEAARAWLKEGGNPYTAVGADRAGRIAIELGVTGAPESWLIDKNGIIIYHIAGPLTEQIWKEELLPLIETP